VPAKLQKHALEVGALISTSLRLNKHKSTQICASSCMRRKGIDDNEISSFGQRQYLKKCTQFVTSLRATIARKENFYIWSVTG
jgi:hypothetical protein